MRLRGKLFQDMEPDDVLALVADEVPESVELDYKERLPGEPSERKEFAKDVAAMANTRGGVLLYGIVERVENGKKTGLPEKVVSLGQLAADHELRRLEQVIRDLSDPHITQCSARALTLPSGDVVVAIGVPRSLLGPHAVEGSYYRRGATSNYRMPTLELRQAFLEHEAWDRDVRAFREDRVSRVRVGEVIPKLDTRGSFFLHILPLGRLNAVVDIVARRGDLMALGRPSTLEWQNRANLDGYLLQTTREGTCTTYAQWLRCGGVEFYSSQYHHLRGGDEVLDLDAARMAWDAYKYAKIVVRYMNQTLEVDPPYALLMCVLDVKGGSIYTKGWESTLPLEGPRLNHFDDDVLMLPGVAVVDTEASLRDAMLPLFDMIWQAAGFDDCFMRRAESLSW
jgi:Putative DNA-binding domain